MVDNASTDGTGAFLDEHYPQVARLNLKENQGRAGGMCAGVRWSHCNKFDWTWVLRDGIRVKPECLETMLRFGDQADMIQVRTENAAPFTPNEPGWIKMDRCDYQGTLIGTQVMDAVGLPDDRYVEALDDTSYGLIASHKTSSILLDYSGLIRLAEDRVETNRATIYLSVRNRFLNRENLTRNGLAPNPLQFYWDTLLILVRKLGEAAGMGGDRARNAMAAVDGLRDGFHGRFDRIPRL